MARKFLRAVVLALPVMLAGCDPDTYPQDLAYPIRGDAVYPENVIKDLNAKAQPQRIDRPGEFPALLAHVDPALTKGAIYASELPSDARQGLQAVLEKLFGTPAAPKVELPSATVSELHLDPTQLELGGRIYRQQCLHCHGLTGDGRGPTAAWVNPHPRDYRLGRFKFTSSSQDEGARKPRREDLLRTLREGIEGTSMPAFRLLPEEHLEALASYVMHLSLRGEVEVYAISQITSGELKAAGMDEDLTAALGSFAGRWQDAEKAAIRPGPNAVTNPEQQKASAQRGYALFMSKGEAGCIGCHLNFGRQNNFTYDAWGTITKPIDLTQGVFRGGRRPLDLYYRVHSGINGSGMTAFGKSLNPDQIWDLVNFLQVLPYPRMRQEYGINID